MVQGRSRYAPRLQTTSTDHRVTFHSLDQIPPLEMETRITDIFNAIIRKAAENMKNDDMIRYHMSCKGWKDDLNLEYGGVNELTGPRILDAFYKIAQSNDSTRLDADDVHLNIMHTSFPAKGSGWTEHGSCRNRIFLQLEKWLQVKQCAITTINNDNLCLARSLVVAIAHHKKQTNPTPENKAHLKLVMDGRRQKQTSDAKQLHNTAGVAEGPCGLAEIQCFQDYLTPLGYKIHVFSANVNFNTVFVGPDTCDKKLALLLFNKHFIVITKIPAFFNTSAFCWECLKGLNHPKKKHRCEKICYYCQDARCHAPSPPPGTRMVLCAMCFRRFKNDDCLQNHMENGTCDKIHRCRHCFCQMYMDEEQQCGLKMCKYCKKMVNKEHLCYMQRPNGQYSALTKNDSDDQQETSTITCQGTTKRKLVKQGGRNKRLKTSNIKVPIIYYYDYEATQESGIHTPNLVVVQQEDGNPEDQKNFKNSLIKNCNDKF